MVVGSGATVGGNGTIAALTAQSGATVAPGNSIGTLTVNGNLSLAEGSTLAMEVSSNSADLIAASGTATLAGAIVITAERSPTYLQNYTLLSSSALTGTFSTITLGDYGPTFRASLLYTDTSVILRVDPNLLVDISTEPLRGNALGVARAFDTAVLGAYDPRPFLSLYNLEDGLSGALGQLSGELRSAERRVALQDTLVVREAAFDRLNDGLAKAVGTAAVTKAAADQSTTVWMRTVGAWETAQADGTGSRLDTEQTGIIVGADFASNGFKVGGLLHRTRTDVDLGALGQSTVESTGAALYAGYRQEASGVAVGFGAGLVGSDTFGSRTITIPDLTQSLTARTESMTYQFFGEAAFDLAKADDTRIEPFARLVYVQLDSGTMIETGGIAALRAGKQGHNMTFATLGMRAAQTKGGTTLSGSAGWQRTGGDRAASTDLMIADLNVPHQVRSGALDRHSVAVDAQAQFQLSPSLMIGVRYSTLVGANNSRHSGHAMIGYVF